MCYLVFTVSTSSLHTCFIDYNALTIGKSIAQGWYITDSNLHVNLVK